MGSNLKATNIPEVLKKGLLKMFGGLKQTVLWKFEEDIPGTPDNMHILYWAPQQSILAHPKCVLFITHGGYLSTTETVHFGIPIIGVPVFADQFINVDRAVAKGIAQRVDLAYDMVDKLKVAIEEAVSNPRGMGVATAVRPLDGTYTYDTHGMSRDAIRDTPLSEYLAFENHL